ncbi:efflux RND transporter permease subunit [Sphingorhabdus sp. 109]|uniref:efflux RND transporter permease subunit n=1 Tax=Sphingorhabdus sp. 109 TaxID=2653173 RepID=UPI0012F4583F|nr:efflux RND transporter permease subunit [Sphingorhabdus sp. 109]VWX62370.1 Multidrug resistance protein MdtC [Sphingorhabdus sp. 109]
MWISDVSIRRPVFATMVIASLVVLGLLSFGRLGVDLFPKIEFPYVSVTTTLPGASPDTIETEITDVIEEEVNSVSGIRQMRSVSAEGVSQVVLEFELSEDADVKAQDVRDRVASILSNLPEESDAPIVEKLDPDAAPILSLLIAGDAPVRELTVFADEVVKERLQRIRGVGSISIVGGREREMRVWLDPAKMRASAISTDNVVAALRNENAELPGGRLEIDGRSKQYGTRTLAEANTASEFGNLAVAYRPNGQVTRVRDIGRVEDSVEDETSYAQLNGRPGVVLEVRKQSGSNTVAMTRAIKAEIEQIKDQLPSGVEIVVTRETARFIESAIGDVLFDLMIAVVLVVFVTFFFLLSWRATFIVMLAIPTSVIATFAAFAAFDFTLNFMTLLALTVAIGLLVDDAIVVVEAVQSDVDEGADPMEAAPKATKRVALAVLAGTFATLAVFVPIAFMEGIVGRFFFQYGLAIVFSVSVSLLVALTLSPMLASRFLKSEKEKTGWLGKIEIFHQIMRKRYERLVGWSIRRRYLVFLGAIISLLIGGLFAAMVPATFMALTDRSEFLASVELPLGTGIATAKEASLRADEALRNIEDVEYVFVTIGAGTNQKTNLLDFYFDLSPKQGRSVEQGAIMDQAREVLAKTLPEATDISVVEVPWVSGAGVGSAQIELIISGSDLTTINEYANIIAEEMRATPELVDVASTYEGGRPELQIRLDRNRAADLGVTARDVAAATRTLIGGSDAGTFEADGRRYDVRVRVDEDKRQTLNDIARLPVRSGSGSLVDLAAVADIEVADSPAQIDRVDRARRITVMANTPPGVALSVAVAQVEKILTNNPPPEGMSTKMEGMARRLADTTSAILLAFALAFVALYIVLASQFNSFGQPVLIMLTAPLSFSGAFIALWLSNQELSMFAQIGMIALMGIVMKNGILLVDLANEYRRGGMDAADAMQKAAPERLRPVLMTALAAIFGMMPVAFAQSDGAEWRNAMGFIIMGGLATSTFLTLLVVPAAYALPDDYARLKTRVRAKLSGGLWKERRA